MSETNDIELADKAREVQSWALLLDQVMRDGTLGAVIGLASRIEDASRKLGWRALELSKKR